MVLYLLGDIVGQVLYTLVVTLQLHSVGCGNVSLGAVGANWDKSKKLVPIGDVGAKETFSQSTLSTI